MNLTAVAGLPSRPVAAVWYRAVQPRHLPTALGYAHTSQHASRFSEGASAVRPFPILYLAENQSLALFEVEAQFGSPLTPGGVVANPRGSWLIINAQVSLSKVADLTDVATAHASLSTTAQELTGDWRGYRQRSTLTSVRQPVGAAPTQELGAALHASGSFEGFLAISAKQPYSMVLAIFPDRMASTSYVLYTYIDSAGREQTFRVP